MGNDGGSIPKRAELVRVRPRVEKAPVALQREMLAMHCALSGAPLRPPLALCRRGMVYSRSAIEEFLAEGRSRPDFAHIARIEDVKELPRTTSENGWGLSCALSDLPFTGNADFVCLWSCGCLLAAKTITRLGLDSRSLRECPSCAQPVLPGQTITLRKAVSAPASTTLSTRSTALPVKRVKAFSGAAGLCQPSLQGLIAAPRAKRAEELLLGGNARLP